MGIRLGMTLRIEELIGQVGQDGGRDELLEVRP